MSDGSKGSSEGSGERKVRRSVPVQREAILAAATRCFADRGYPLSSIRDIADMAGINSSLVGRYVGTKATLFREVLGAALDMSEVLSGPREAFGQRIFGIFTSTRDVPSPLAIMLLSMGDVEARTIVLDLLAERIIEPMADYLGEPGGRDRAVRLNMLWSGYLVGTQLLPTDPLERDQPQRHGEWLIAATQAILDDDRF